MLPTLKEEKGADIRIFRGPSSLPSLLLRSNKTVLAIDVIAYVGKPMVLGWPKGSFCFFHKMVLVALSCL